MVAAPADNTIRSYLGFLRLLVSRDNLSAVQERQQQSMAHFACVQKVSLQFYGAISYSGCMPFDIATCSLCCPAYPGYIAVMVCVAV